MTINIFSIIGSTVFLAVIIYQVWKQRLSEAYALLWLLVGGAMLAFSLFPKQMMSLAKLVGIYYPPTMLLLGMCVGLFMIAFQFSLVISKRGREVRRLTQELALLEERLRKLEEKSEE